MYGVYEGIEKWSHNKIAKQLFDDFLDLTENCKKEKKHVFYTVFEQRRKREQQSKFWSSTKRVWFSEQISRVAVLHIISTLRPGSTCCDYRSTHPLPISSARTHPPPRYTHPKSEDYQAILSLLATDVRPILHFERHLGNSICFVKNSSATGENNTFFYWTEKMVWALDMVRT